MSRRRGSVGSLIAALPLCALGACAPRWTVLRQAAPGALRGQRVWVAAPVALAAAVAGDAPAEAAALQRAYAARLAARHGALTFDPTAGGGTLRPLVSHLDAGRRSGFLDLAADVKMTVQLIDSTGALRDEIALETSVGADLYHPTAIDRVQQAGVQLADLTLRYLTSRVEAP